MAQFAIIVLSSNSASLYTTAATFGSAIDEILSIKSSCEENQEVVKIVGTYQYPRYVKGSRSGRTFPTSISVHGEFIYIKKVNDGESVEDVIERASLRRRQHANTSFAENCYYSHARNGRRPMSSAEREEYEHCMNMGDFDY